MSDDLLNRLRHAAKFGGHYAEAADRIEELEDYIKNVVNNPLGIKIQRDRIEELEEDLRKANL